MGKSLSALFLVVAAVLRLVATTTAPLNTVPNAYILELESSDDLVRRGVSPHSALYANLDSAGIKWDVRTEYNDPSLFVGTSIELEDEKDFDALAQIPGLKGIYPIRMFQRPQPTYIHIVRGTDDPAIPPDSESTHIMTGVDKLHAEGYLGKGITVGIIDTGTDYYNQYLGGCFGPGCKVAFGYDFVGDDYNGTNTPVPDPDPLDTCAGHGTHVAGIVAADPNNPYNISGVAYEATLASYRVFGCTGTASDDVIVEAMMAAYNDSCDILTLSLGGVEGWTESVSGDVASRIAQMGKIVTIAAGNDGQYGAWYTSAPGTGLDVISVASVDNTVVPYQNLTVSTGYGPITYGAVVPVNVTGPHPIYATSTNTSIVDDACDPLPASTPDLSDYIVVIKRGTCAFVQKLANAAAFGAQYFLIYDNLVEAFISPEVGNYTAVLISNADGIYLVDQFAAGNNITVVFPQTGALFDSIAPTGGLVSTFTSYGPTQDMFFKPAVAAPGGNILSTYLVSLGSFALLSGTSMATPFMAGSAALLLQARGKSNYTTSTARTLFETTAKMIPGSNNESTPLQTVAQQGAGLVNVYNALHYTTILTPGELLLNDTANFKGDQHITVTNTGSRSQTYTLTHVPAGTILTYNESFPIDGPLALGGATASVGISLPKFTLWPGEFVVVNLLFKPPQGLDASTVPVYSGFIQVSSDSGETLHSSYIGVAAALKDVQVLDNTNAYFGFTLPALVDENGNPLTPANGTVYFSCSPSDQPSILFRLLSASPVVRIDLVSSTESLNTTYARRDEKRRYPFGTNKRQEINSPSSPGGSFGAVPIIGPIVEYDYFPRSSDAADYADNGYNEATWNGTFANGSCVANGLYKVLLRALRTTGDPANEADYESWLSPAFGIALNVTGL